VKITSFRILLAWVAVKKLIVHCMDVKNAFFNGRLKEKIYIRLKDI
jgi:hypothetical protein